MTNRELVYQTLEHKNKTGIVPRQLWSLPYADIAYPGEADKVRNRFPEAICSALCNFKTEPIWKGDKCKKGISVDEWGCVFTNTAFEAWEE